MLQLITYYFASVAKDSKIKSINYNSADYNGMCAYFAGIDWVQLFTCVAPMMLMAYGCYSSVSFAMHWICLSHIDVSLCAQIPPHIMSALKRKRYLWRRRHLAGGLSRYNLEAVRCERLIMRYHHTKE